jgi:hypothetical protein
MSSYRLTIVESGSGDEYEVGVYDSLPSCTSALNDLENQHKEWLAQGCPKLPQDHLLRHYEGCDAYAYGSDGTLYAENDGYWRYF